MKEILSVSYLSLDNAHTCVAQKVHLIVTLPLKLYFLLSLLAVH